MPPTIITAGEVVDLTDRTRHQVSDLTGFKTRPTAEHLDSIEAAYRAEGFTDVEAVPKTGLEGRGWAVAVFATNNPYEATR